MATTEAEWLRVLPRAVGEHACCLAHRQAQVRLGSGQLTIAWRPLPPRAIALLYLQRLAVVFSFEGVQEVERQAFMKHFDLSTHRGGG